MKLDRLIAAYEPLLARLIDESDGAMYRAFYLQPNPEVKLNVEQGKNSSAYISLGFWNARTLPA